MNAKEIIEIIKSHESNDREPGPGDYLDNWRTEEIAKDIEFFWNTRHESKPLTYVQLQSTYSKAYHDFLNAFPKGPDPARNNKAHEAGLSAIHAALPSETDKDRRIAELEKAVDARQDLIERWRELALSREKTISALKADMEQKQDEAAEKQVAGLTTAYKAMRMVLQLVLDDGMAGSSENLIRTVLTQYPEVK